MSTVTIFKRPESLLPVITHYCPGCTHGTIHRLVAEVMDELGIRERTIGTAPVGCAVLLYDYFNCDIIECPHGRIPAVATGIKRMRPDNIVFAYGDQRIRRLAWFDRWIEPSLPKVWHALETQLMSGGFTREDLIDAGLLVQRPEPRGIHAVPAVIIDDRHLISGGQPVEVFEEALRRIASGKGEN